MKVLELGSVRAVPYKEVAPKFDLPSLELN